MGKRKRHTEEFKREAVRLMETRGIQSTTNVAEELGILTNQRYDWRHQFGDVRLVDTFLKASARIGQGRVLSVPPRGNTHALHHKTKAWSDCAPSHETHEHIAHTERQFSHTG